MKKQRLVNRGQDCLFKKRHFVNIINETVDYCTKLFGYKKKPYVFETINQKGEMMYIRRGYGGCYGIFYDYMQFKRMFSGYSYEVMEAYAMFFIAHEMRHYYQMRQIDSKTPRENPDLIEKWRQNDENGSGMPSPDTIKDFYLQPMEIDAELFAYTLVASYLDCLVDLSYISADYVDELEKYHFELFGEGDDMLFPKENSDDE